MSARCWIVCGALLGGLGVVLGAFGTHGIQEAPPEKFGWNDQEKERRVAIYETAARYQMYHAPAILVVGLLLLRGPSRTLQAAGIVLGAGVLIFCGLLYVLVFAPDQWRWLGMVVPLGGLSLIVGWVLLAVGAARWVPDDTA